MSVLYFRNKARLAMFLAGFLCMLLMLVSLPAWSGKVYKWVDSNGLVHYSQVPPRKDQVRDKSDISEKVDSGAIPATRKGDYAYCGEIKLPGPLYEPKSILLGLGNRVESWSRSLQGKERSLERQLHDLGSKNRQRNTYSSRNSYSSYGDRAAEERKKTARKISEYRCALGWADRQKKKYSDIRQEAKNDLQGAKLNYQAALDAAHQACGFEPKDYASPNYNKKKSAWKKCMRPYDRKIRSSEQAFKNLRRQVNKFE